MADDPNRDILPVREGSCVDTCRSSIDHRERHLVYKLDRYELEDKYLRLLEEVRNLKKLSNCQEDKIKRLATKLMRVTANPRACNVTLDVYDDKNRIIAIELENSKLKDKISVLKNQLLSHKISGRSSSRSRNPQARPSSGRISCRTESSRTKVPSCHCITETGDDDNDAKNNLDKIEEFDAEKKEMANRIAELEKELSECTASNQRVKIAENIEYIKVWRQMKQLSDKLIAAENTNKSLNAQIDDLKWKLEEATKRNYEITASLDAEKKRLTELNEELLKAKQSEFSLREKDEQIRDLMNEMKILQQHNSELVDLSSRRGDVEQENMELKKKVTEQLHDQETLRNAFNSEQANITALRSSNEQLLGKLEVLQKNIDSLTSFQTQTEKQEMSKTTQISTKQTDMRNPRTTDKAELYKSAASQMERCKKCCEAFEKILQLEKNICVPRGNANPVDKCVQTESVTRSNPVNVKDQATSIATPVKKNPKKEEPVKETVKENVEQMSTENPLTSEKMLKLLDQAQFNTPTDSMRFVQKNMINDVDYNMSDFNQRHSDIETSVQANQALRSRYQQQKSNNDTSTAQPLESQFTDPNKILSILCNILQGYSQTRSISNEVTLYRPISPVDHQFVKDVNNNVAKKILQEKFTNTSFEFDVANENAATNVLRVGCGTRRSCSRPHNRLRPEKLRRKVVCDIRKHDRTAKLDGINDCTCNNLTKCNIDSSCQQRCCNGNFSRSILESISDTTNNNKRFSNNTNFDTSTENYSPQGPNVSFLLRNLQDDEETKPYNSWENHTFPQKKNSSIDDENTLQEYIEHLDKCKELVNHGCSMNNTTGISVKKIVNHSNVKDSLRYRDFNDESMPETHRTESICSLNCPNECVDTSSSLSDSFPLVIPEGQGLLEFHIVSLQLSTCAQQILVREKNIDNVSLFVSWDIWNQETMYTPTLKCPKLNFNSSFVYRISDLFSFFNYVLLEFVIFKVNVYHEDRNNYTVARGKLCIKDILDYPQNKLHYIAPVNSMIPCSLGMNFGQLSLWVRLSCDVEKVDRFKNTRGILTEYRESPEECPIILTQPIIETPVRAGLKDDLTVLKEMNPNAHLMYEPSKETVSRYQSPTINGSSDTIDAHEINTAQSFSKVPLTVVKESEEDSHFHSSYENTDHALPAPRSFTTGGRIKSGNTTKTMQTRDSGESFESKQYTNNDAAMTDTNSENHRLSVQEFNALISKKKQEATVQEGSDESISEVTNVISEKNWEEYKQRSLLTFASTHRTDSENAKTDSVAGLTIDSQSDADTITIDILSMILFPKSSVMQNKEIQLLYIEYSFLGYSGADMETMSVEKPRPPETKLTYNFKRKFQVNEETHSMQNNMLRAMLNNTVNPHITFVIVSEPLPEETDFKECVEVGFAKFNLKEYAFGDSEKVVSVQVYSTDESEQIGLLKIYVLGLDTIHQRLGRRESNL